AAAKDLGMRLPQLGRPKRFGSRLCRARVARASINHYRSVPPGSIIGMLLSRLAQTRVALAATRSRNAKRDLIAGLLAETGPEDIEIVVSYLSGSLRQRRTGVGWRSLQMLPGPAGEPS